MTYLFFLFGLALLVAGAEGFVRGASSIALRLGISPLLIGLTLVGFGTSAPELVISIDAVLNDAPGLVMGNIVGTNTANILLILGLGAVITPIAVDKSILRRDGTMLAIATLAAIVSVLTGSISRPEGAIFLVLLVAYLVFTYFDDRRAMAKNPAAAPEPDAKPIGNLWLAIAMTVFGLVLILIGARFLVDAAIDIARMLGVSETVIGLTIVAVGTSSPEIAITIVSALRRNMELALGNILGSNIFNILGILGITALVQPIAIPAVIAEVDIWVMTGATLALLLAAFTGRQIVRWEGILMLLAYAIYVGWLVVSA